MRPIYLGLGSNQGDRFAHLALARQRLAGTAGVRLTGQSALYQTRPLGLQDQGAFVNQVVRIETDHSLPAVLALSQAIEQAAGRAPRHQRAVWGPRELDIDLLLAGEAGDESWDTPELVVPHPAWSQRRFVLRPLADLVPDRRLGGQALSVTELLDRLPAEGPGAEIDRWTEAPEMAQDAEPGTMERMA